MSWSLPQLGAFMGFMMAIYLTNKIVKSVAIVAIVAVVYIISAWVLWQYSPYRHRYSAATTAPVVEKSQKWGFQNDSE